MLDLARILLKESSEEAKKCFASLFRLSLEGHLSVKESDLECPHALPSSLIGKLVIREGDRIYLQKNWMYETLILEQIKRLKNSKPAPLFEEATFQEHLQNETLLPEQREVLRKAFVEPFFILCGGPGTGKTYTATRFIHLLSASLVKGERLHLCIAAPTGKAATHLQNALLSQGALNPSLHIQTTTLHRLLKLQPGENRLFSGRRIDADLILVDEASMIDVSLLAHLLEAVGDGSRLFLMGDPDQLPPVETISLFPEIASLLGVSLKTCVRTEDRSLTELAEAIRKGDSQAMISHLQQPLPWAFDSSLPSRLLEKIQPIITPEKPDPMRALDHYASLRILNALRQGPFGTDQLNRQIAQLLEMRMKEGQWCAMPILITANDPHSQLYNGMTGVLISQKPIHLRKAVAFFPGREGEIRSLPPFELAFCLSIHKSQGSEFEEVIALFPPGSENFGKESLYTAVTRAKRRFQWMGEKEVLCKMVEHPTKRTSGFIERFFSLRI